MDIAFAAILHEGAPEGERSNRPGNDVSENHAGESSEKRDSEGFGEELDQDVPPARPQCFFDADFASALRNRD